MTIHLLENKEIDKHRWDGTIQHSPNGLIYGKSLYLDHLSPGWQALVNEDYSLLMPLTVKKKMGFSYLCQPPFCQQLGIFGTAAITEGIIKAFILKAMHSLSFAEIYLNFQNFVHQPPGVQERKNYVLDLHDDYQAIRGLYTNNLVKKSLKRIEKYPLKYTAGLDVEKAIQLSRQLYGDRIPHVTETDYTAFTSLCNELLIAGHLFIREVSMADGELLVCGLFLKDEKRIYNIISSTLPNGRRSEANYFLFDQLIQEFAGTGLLLDFEGSDLPGIERFYKKFGATDQPYYFLRWNELPWPLKWMK